MCEIESPWFEKIPMHDKEKGGLEENPHNMPYGENRRYACTFLLEPWMEEMVIEIRSEWGNKAYSHDDISLKIQAWDDH